MTFHLDMILAQNLEAEIQKEMHVDLGNFNFRIILIQSKLVQFWISQICHLQR